MMISMNTFLFCPELLKIQIVQPTEKSTIAEAQNNMVPGLLNKKDHASGLVPARYRLNSARKTPASSAHNAKKITYSLSLPVSCVAYLVRSD
jgi:hypothetical protein